MSLSNNKRILLFTFSIIFLPIKIWAAANITYTLAMPQPQTHYFEVEMTFASPQKDYVDVKMPVWTPGSYLVREYAKNVEGFTASANNQPVRFEKINKNTWRIYSQKVPQVKINYKVYAFELTVRTSFLDAEHGYANGASVFMYPDGLQKEKSEIKVVPFKDWKVVSTALAPASESQPFTFQAADYDEVVDSPIEIGNHNVWQFEVNGVPHQVAMFGESNVNKDKFLADLKKITTTATQIMGDQPINRYLFIIHNTSNGGGGLEHKYSTTLQVKKWNYASAAGYNSILSLAAHEYFHLWNIKRLRPAGLGPFNYDAETYTNLLWVSEGFTSYYANLIVRRSGFQSNEQYLNTIAKEISDLENTPGVRVQSAAESSFDAWIKYYRPNENSINAGTSYYSKGSVIGTLLNLEILQRTKGRKNLDDLMRQLYQQYYKKLDRGFTDAEFKQAAESVAGGKLDAFFNDYIYGTKTPDYVAYFNYAGLHFVNLNTNKPEASLGAKVSLTTGKQIVTTVLRDGSAWQGGLNVNDEIIALNGYRITDGVNLSLSGARAGQPISLLINRDGQMLTLEFPLVATETRRFEITPNEKAGKEQAAILNKWTNG
ncbi:peptidase M61 [Adhaeribacter arboris]|uniref:Peptidase M61 n=1 Tax=Adhaeribacter arboris TaxID=2072846 RepID=A0A2T2YDQ7_9BACT|nr:PDZ domain-containing protein [Adhaeribacter arboris]PSR53647.1 peptidase M61 [Adhaeribacter arboris]